MLPIIQLGSLEISSYALMLALGACVCSWLTLQELRRKRLDEDAMVTLTAIMLTAGMVGARGTSLILNRGLPAGSVSSILTLWDPAGMWFFGGFLVAGAAGLTWVLIRGVPILEAADTLATTWVPLISFIRVGCFLNGCCYGRPTTSPLGLVTGGSINNVNFGIPSHPAQLYAVAATLAVFVVLWRGRLRRRFTGELAAAFLVLYPAFGFVHEFLRGDPRIAWSLAGLGTLTLNQVVSVLLLGTGAAMWLTLSPPSAAPGAGAP
jgi:phosphatidylglycerol---prolipoprotein diacylglyceryl transferase